MNPAGNGFIAAGTASFVYQSTDGMNWSRTSVDSNSYSIATISYLPGYGYLMGVNGGIGVKTSPDLVTWTTKGWAETASTSAGGYIIFNGSGGAWYTQTLTSFTGFGSPGISVGYGKNTNDGSEVFLWGDAFASLYSGSKVYNATLVTSSFVSTAIRGASCGMYNQIVPNTRRVILVN